MDNLNQTLESEYKKYFNGDYDAIYAKLEEKVKRNIYTPKEYKEYLKIKNVKENLSILTNIMNYINHLKELKNEDGNEKRQIEKKKLLEKEYNLKKQIESLLKDYESLSDILKEVENEGIDNEYIKCQIKKDIEDSPIKNVEYANIKQQIDEISKKQDEIIEKRESFEEQRNITIKINQFYKVAEYLLKGHSWDDTVEYLLSWQKKRYNLNEKDKRIVKNDIEDIRQDMKIANEIIDIALLNEKLSRESDEER